MGEPAVPNQPAAQPGDGVSLPVKAFTYNMWDEVEKTTENMRKPQNILRLPGQYPDIRCRGARADQRRESSPATDTALPKVTNEYNTETGALEKQSATISRQNQDDHE